MDASTPSEVTKDDIVAGLAELGLGPDSAVIVHSSLRSFGHVDGGAEAVVAALVEACGTVMMVGGSWDLVGVPAPPGLVRPNNAPLIAGSWADFDAAIEAAVPYTPDLPIDSWLGIIPEAMRRSQPHERGVHPLFAFIASGRHDQRLIAAQRLDWSLGPIEELEALDGYVLLLGVGHFANTTIHLAEQRLGRSLFFRYAKLAPRVWMELPNISGESHRFDGIEPHLRSVTREVMIGDCRARLIRVADVLDVTTRLVEADPAALLCDDPGCRCGAALQQRLAHLQR